MTEKKGIDEIIKIFDSIRIPLLDLKTALEQVPLKLLDYSLEFRLDGNKKDILKYLFQRRENLDFKVMSNQIYFCYRNQVDGKSEEIFRKDLDYLMDLGVIIRETDENEIEYYQLHPIIFEQEFFGNSFKEYILFK